MFFPTQVTAIVGLLRIQFELGLINRTWGLVFPYVALTVAISIFVMRSMFQLVSREIVDSARIDGASPLRTLAEIVLPIVRNGVVVVIILNFSAAWGEYLLADTLMNDWRTRTLAVFVGRVGPGPGAAAIYMIALVPALIVFGIAQHWFFRGLQEGAIKG
ncbi:hypothetical protein BH23CHL5_BH23CHL5_26060 [soil metagenome]